MDRFFVGWRHVPPGPAKGGPAPPPPLASFTTRREVVASSRPAGMTKVNVGLPPSPDSGSLSPRSVTVHWSSTSLHAARATFGSTSRTSPLSLCAVISMSSSVKVASNRFVRRSLPDLIAAPLAMRASCPRRHA